MRELLERRSRVPFGRPAGECRLIFRDDGIFIERADRHVWLTDDFLARLTTSERHNQWVSLTWGARDLCDPTACCQTGRDRPHCYTGAILAVWGINGNIMYRIGGYSHGVWEARWSHE
jgi:hypothetical protein